MQLINAMDPNDNLSWLSDCFWWALIHASQRVWLRSRSARSQLAIAPSFCRYSYLKAIKAAVTSTVRLWYESDTIIQLKGLRAFYEFPTICTFTFLSMSRKFVRFSYRNCTIVVRPTTYETCSTLLANSFRIEIVTAAELCKLHKGN